VDTSPQIESEAKKRRSTRIVQAVPLTVTGVDALGRPFQERTSTLIINCQGCRYQSKHYVLKNMWLTFEVPHPETGQPPRSVRARVTWVQRPRTIRELFQIGAELETPGNLWGVAFPPADWTPFPDAPEAEIPLPSEPAAASAAPADESATAVTSEHEPTSADSPAPTESESHAEIPQASNDNLRVMPSPAAADETLLLARQMTRLLNEAKQQLQESAHTQAAQAVSAEIRSLLFSIENQLRDAAEKSVQEAASTHGEEILRAALENISQGEIERLSARWTQEAERHVRTGVGRFSVELDELERRRRDELEEHLGRRFDQLRAQMEDATRALDVESAAAQARLEQWRHDTEETTAANLRRWTELAEATTARAQTQMTELEAAAARIAERISATTTDAEAGWRGRLEADVASANARMAERVETSLEAAARSAADRLANNSESSAHELERQIAQRIETLGRAFSEAKAEAESALGTIRAAISKETGRAQSAVTQLHEAAAQVEDHRAILDGLRRSSSDELDRRSEELLESHSAELNRRAEAIANSVAERLEPGLIAAGRQMLSTLASEIQQQLAPQIERATTTLRELEAGTAHTDEALRAHEDRLRELSERSLHETSVRVEETARRFDAQLQEAGAAAQARVLGEIEAKATDTTHEAFESIFKSAEWYEKKVQTQMQATLEKGLAQAAEALRAKAGEISSQFAAELDHYTRSYVEHAKEQMDEQAQTAAARTREAAQAAADAIAGGFSDRAAKIATEQYQRVLTDSAAVGDQFAVRLDAQRAEVQSKIDGATREAAAQFRAELDTQSRESLAAAKAHLDERAETLTESWRSARASEMQQVELNFARLGNQAVEEYKQRLENTSNTWVLASVTKLNEHSKNLIEQLATASEERIRAACSGVFAEIGESLRQRIALAPEAEPHTTPGTAPAPESDHPHSNG